MNLTNEDLERIEELQEWFETDEDLADSDMVDKLAELKAMYELFKDLHEKYIRLDNYRCNNLHRLCSILAYTDLKLSEKVKKYEF